MRASKKASTKVTAEEQLTMLIESMKSLCQQAEMTLQAMSHNAQQEKEMARKRQAEGIAAAKAKGKKLGRKPIQMPSNFGELVAECS